MDRMTIVFVDGHEEKYVVRRDSEKEGEGFRMKAFKEMVSDNMLKLIVYDGQVVIIPFSNIRKIMYQPNDKNHLGRNYPGFLHVENDSLS